MRFFRILGASIKWTLIVCALLIVVVIVIAIVGLGNASNKSEKSSHQVTPARYASVHTGMTKSRVRALLGKPETTDVTAVQGLSMECWEYGVLATSGTYQFCFDNGRLSSKSKF